MYSIHYFSLFLLVRLLGVFSISFSESNTGAHTYTHTINKATVVQKAKGKNGNKIVEEKNKMKINVRNVCNQCWILLFSSVLSVCCMCGLTLTWVHLMAFLPLLLVQLHFSKPHIPPKYCDRLMSHVEILLNCLTRAQMIMCS